MPIATVPDGLVDDLKLAPHEVLRRVEVVGPRTVIVEIAYDLNAEPGCRGLYRQRYGLVAGKWRFKRSLALRTEGYGERWVTGQSGGVLGRCVRSLHAVGKPEAADDARQLAFAL